MPVFVLYLPLLIYRQEIPRPLCRSGVKMAIIQSALLSKGKGSAGSVTFRRMNGKTIVSEKAIEVKNPQTFPQQLQRAYMLVASRWLAGFNAYTRERFTAKRNYDGRLSKNGSTLLPRQFWAKELQAALKATAEIREDIELGITPGMNLPNRLYYNPFINPTYLGVYKEVDYTGLPSTSASVPVSQFGAAVADGKATISGTAAVNATSTNVMINVSVTAIIRSYVGGSEGSRFVVSSAVQRMQEILMGSASLSLSVEFDVPAGNDFLGYIIEITPVSFVELQTQLVQNVGTITEPVGIVDWK